MIELWPGKYKENVMINKRLTLLGSGASRTIIDARYLGSAIRLQSSSDYSVIENISVIRSKNSSSTCSSTTQYAGIDAYQSYNLKINNVRFIDNAEHLDSMHDLGSNFGEYTEEKEDGLIRKNKSTLKNPREF